MLSFFFSFSLSFSFSRRKRYGACGIRRGSCVGNRHLRGEKGSILVAEESYFDDIIIIIIMVNALWASFVIIFPKDSKNLTRKFL